ncbi:MAG: hypothetical protein V3V35_09945 [Dehalococcoidia bacterium]
MFHFLRGHRRVAAGLIVLGLAVLVLSACNGDDATPTPRPQPTATPRPQPTAVPPPATQPPAVMEVMEQSGPDSLTIALGELNASGQAGKATLTARGDQTEVVIEVASGPAGVAQPIHIHEGTCDTLGGVKFALTSLQGGKSTTLVDASLASLRTGQFSINGHKSADEIAVYIACGDLPETVVINLNELNASGQAGTATLTTRGDQTEVVIEVAPGPAGVAQPIHIHEGTCDPLGGVKFALTSLQGGKSTTLVDASLASLRTGQFSINGHKSADEIAVYIACGDLHAGDAMMTDNAGDAMMTDDATATPRPQPTATPAPSEGATVMAVIENFTHQNLTIKVGTTVIWTQRDSTVHTSTSGESPSPDGMWDTGPLSQGQSSDGIKFDQVGTFQYFCTIHPSIQATVTVTAEEPSQASETSAGSGEGGLGY